jgi:hypothetical protein
MYDEYRTAARDEVTLEAACKLALGLATALRSLKLRIHNIDADDALARAAVAAENIVDDELNPALEAAGDAANRLHPQAITSEPKARWG